MANVIFKRGLQNNLDAIAKTDGVFYLTTDTGRLYVDIENERKLLNQAIRFIDTLQSLKDMADAWTAAEKTAHIQDLYYITDANILAIFTDTGWVQINPDTDTVVSNANTSFAVGDIVNNGSTVTLTIKDTDGHTLATPNFGVVGAGGVTLSKDSSNNLVITGETYNISSSAANDHAQASITLNNSTTAVGAVNLVAGDGNIQFEQVASGIKITTQNTTIDPNGTSVTMPAAGSIKVVVTDSDGNGAAGSTLSNIGIILNDQTYVPIDSTAGKTAGAIYSKAEIDQKLNGLDGMTFKGTLGSSGATIATLPTTGVKNGDVYVIVQNALSSADFVGSTVNYLGSNTTRIGDMLIATGTEGTDGTITSNLEWTYIPSGNDDLDFATYHGVADTANHALSLQDATGSGTDIAKITLTAGDGIALASASSTTAVLTTTISHATYSTTTNAASSLSNGTSTFTAIKGLTLTNGHVTAIETDTFTPVTYHLTGATATQSASFGTNNVGTNTVDVGIGIGDDNGPIANAGATFNLTSSSLKMTANNNGSVAVNIEWGTFGS